MVSSMLFKNEGKTPRWIVPTIITVIVVIIVAAVLVVVLGAQPAPEGKFNPKVGQIENNGYFLSWATSANTCDMMISDQTKMLHKDQQYGPCSIKKVLDFLIAFGSISEEFWKIADDLFVVIPAE